MYQAPEGRLSPEARSDERRADSETDDPELSGAQDDLQPVLDAPQLIDMPDVGLHRAFGVVKLLGNLCVRVPSRDELDELTLAGAQRRHIAGRLVPRLDHIAHEALLDFG